jgi:hypothetical protein
MKIPAILASIAALFLVATTASAGVYTGNFAGTNEAPPNASPGSGNISVTIDELLQTMLVEISFSDLTGNVTAAHLHCCAGPGVNAGVAVNLIGFPVGVIAGSYSASFDLALASTYSASFLGSVGGTTASASSALIAALVSGLVYGNIHTSMFPGGEIRSDLVSEIPLPAAAWLFLAAGIPLVRAMRIRPRS